MMMMIVVRNGRNLDSLLGCGGIANRQMSGQYICRVGFIPLVCILHVTQTLEVKDEE